MYIMGNKSIQIYFITTSYQEHLLDSISFYSLIMAYVLWCFESFIFGESNSNSGTEATLWV